MKAYLVVLLFALTACTFPDDLLKLAKCVLSSPTVYEVLPKVIEAVKNGDYFTLLQLALTEVPVIKDEVLECMGEPILKFNCYRDLFLYCQDQCKLGKGSDKWYILNPCINACRKKYYC